jgi:hypothetical protein
LELRPFQQFYLVLGSLVVIQVFLARRRVLARVFPPQPEAVWGWARFSTPLWWMGLLSIPVPKPEVQPQSPFCCWQSQALAQ